MCLTLGVHWGEPLPCSRSPASEGSKVPSLPGFLSGFGLLVLNSDLAPPSVQKPSFQGSRTKVLQPSGAARVARASRGDWILLASSPLQLLSTHTVRSQWCLCHSVRP